MREQLEQLEESAATPEVDDEIRAQHPDVRRRGWRSTLGLASRGARRAGRRRSPTMPARPEQLTYKPFDFAAPDGDKYRHTLPGGVVVYVVEDHSLPLVKLQATFRTGAFREPEGTRPASRR